MFLNISLGILSLASPFLLQFLTDEVLVRGDLTLLTRLAMVIIVIQLISSSLKIVQSNLIGNFSQRLQLNSAVEFGRRILRLPLNYYESRSSGEILSRLEDLQSINQLASHVVINLPSQFFVSIVSLLVMSSYSQKLTIAGVFLALLMTTSTIIFFPSLDQKTRKVLASSAQNQGVLVETFKGAITVKTTTAENQFTSEFYGRFSNLASLTLKTIKIGIYNDAFSNLVSGIGSLGLLWYGSNLVINREITTGQLLAFNSMFANVTAFMLALIGLVDQFSRFRTATQRLNEIIDTPLEQPEEPRKAWEIISPKADIYIDKINFYHLGRITLLNDFSLKITGGQVIALIGRSGCGKSTLAKIIAGLYSPQSGNIRIGIFNQQDIDLECWRKQIILVPQDAHFWHRSILENFQMGNPNLSFEQIVQACMITGADEFIGLLPDRYYSVLGEFGSNLSGGQRQKLALARAIVNNPPILILDESTSALDPVSEAEVLQALFRHRKEKTTILISHRPRVIRQADWIVLLENGQMIMEGTVKDFGEQHEKFLNP